LHVVPLFFLDEIAPLSKQVDDVRVLESKSRYCNLDMVYRLVFKAQIGKLV